MRRTRSSRSYLSILRANVFTPFNVVLAAFGVLTLMYGSWQDALFLGVIVANSGIGIAQEVRAKRALDRLSLLVAPHAMVVRDGRARRVPLEQVLVGDVVSLSPGDQVIADGRLAVANGLRMDESMLTGESELVSRCAGEDVLSGSFVVEGSATYRVSATGQDSFAARITGKARSFRHPRSPLERAVNRLLYVLVAFVVGLGALLVYSLYHRHVGVHAAVSTATAGVVTLVPEGLMLLVSLTYAAAAVRMSGRGVLAQQLNAIESLASVDTLCIDKTGTLTASALRVVELLPADGVSVQQLHEALARYAASATVRNATLKAIADAMPAEGEQASAEVPFSSARRWSALELHDRALYLGAAERMPSGELSNEVQRREREGRRVLLLAEGGRPLPGEAQQQPPSDLRLLGAVTLAEALRPNVRETIEFFEQQGVDMRVLSGDSPLTAASIAADAGINVRSSASGHEIPVEGVERARFAAATDVIGRISPDGKQAIVEALVAQGRYVAMVGDGVNDVPAMKSARLAVAQGSAVEMAKSVADLILVSEDFAAMPALIAEGRRALRNLQRVSRLYVTKSAFAAFLILSIGIGSDAYPLLPRHLTLAASLTIGIPTFFLALAPSSGGWSVERFGARVARFAVPAGALLGVGVLAGYLFALHDLDLSVGAARTVAVTVLIAGGLYLVLALEAEGSRRRSTLVAAMCAVLAGVYVVVLLVPYIRDFFALAPIEGPMLATALVAAALTIVALTLAGFTVRIWGPRDRRGTSIESPPGGCDG